MERLRAGRAAARPAAVIEKLGRGGAQSSHGRAGRVRLEFSVPARGFRYRNDF